MSEMLGELHRLIETKAVIENAIIAETAMTWLRSYGPKGPVDADSISASVSQNLASACPGAKEAKQYLEAAIQQMFVEISATAMLMCKAQINRAREVVQPSHKEAAAAGAAIPPADRGGER